MTSKRKPRQVTSEAEVTPPFGGAGWVGGGAERHKNVKPGGATEEEEAISILIATSLTKALSSLITLTTETKTRGHLC